MNKVRSFFRKYIPAPALVLYVICLISAVLHIFFIKSRAFSDFFNRNIASVLRAFLAHLTGWLPFSLAETIIICMPVIFVLMIVIGMKMVNRSLTKSWRYIASLLAVVSLLYSLFVLGFASGYRGSPLSDKLGIERRKLSAEELHDTAKILVDGINAELDEVDFIYGGFSVMPWTLDEMNDHLNDAYASLGEKYDFVPHLRSNVKYIMLSEPMTYTHISGVYTYYTGESNICTNFPDYTLPFTAAHELSHQRGIAPENEANFMAFLVCLESDEPYIRYCGYLNMLEYVINALAGADRELYRDIVGSLDMRVRGELAAYGEFYDKYRKSVAATVSNAVNNTYLKVQGQSDGTKSYGMVVDLAAAYLLDDDKIS